MTDADLKQLLTAATKGPWGSFFEIDHYSVWSEDGRKVGTAIMGIDARLIAFAPTLAQEVLDLRAEVARLREALNAQVQFAELISEEVGIDMAETKLIVRVMPEGKEVGIRSWADVQSASRAAIEHRTR